MTVKVRCKKAKPSADSRVKTVWEIMEEPAEPAEPVFEVDTNSILRRLKPGESQEVPCKFCGQIALEVRKDWRGEVVIKPTKMHCKEK